MDKTKNICLVGGALALISGAFCYMKISKKAK